MAPRALLDSNVLVRGLAFASGVPGLVLRAAEQRRFRLVTCEHVLQEVDRVLARLDLLSIRDRHEAIQLVLELAEIAGLPKRIPRVRDAKDSLVLGTALDSEVDYLVTGDRDLLDHRGREAIRIVRTRTFAEALGILPTP